MTYCQDKQNSILMKLHFSLLLFYLFTVTGITAQEYYGKMEGQKLDWAFYYLSENYVDSLDNTYLADLALRTIVAELDPFSSYQSKAEAEAQLNRDNGVTPPSIGFNFYMIDNSKPIISYISRGGPAEKAGLKKGYQITFVNEQSLSNKSQSEIREILNDTSYIELNIEYADSNNSKYKTNLIKEYVPYYSVVSHYMIDGQTGYIKLHSFTKNTVQECTEAIASLKKQGMQKLILDLRDNVGGVMDQSLYLADEFLSEGKLIHTRSGHGLEEIRHNSTSDGHYLSGDLICLVDSYSASSSEIFLGAIQEWDRGLIVGYPTYGKGLIQQSYKLGDGSTLRLTIGRYYTPTGRLLQRPKDDAWFDNLGINIESGTAMAALNLPDSVFTKTMSQRKILAGTGGIYPDIYFVPKAENKVALDKYNSNGHIYDFTTHYVHQYRRQLINSYTIPSNFRLDGSYKLTISNAFKEYLRSQNFAEADDSEFGLPMNIIEQIRSWIAAQVWDDNAYYQLLNVNDQTVQKALELFSDGTYNRIIR